MKARAGDVGAAVNIIQTGIKVSFGILGHSAAVLAYPSEVKQMNQISLFFSGN